ncbi:MAG: AI-2E family transporter [Rhodobacterales bacterium]|nr:AI-2E family transporter [Rhodobacterales bacterium]
MTEDQRHKRTKLADAFYIMAITLMTAMVLYIGKAVFLPIVTAVLVVYVMTSTIDALGRLPVVGGLPRSLRSAFVVAIFVLVILSLALIIESTLTEFQAVLPEYQATLGNFLLTLPGMEAVDTTSLWRNFMAGIVGEIDLQLVIVSILGGITSAGAALFMVIVYAGFLASERTGMSAKLAALFPRDEQYERTETIIRQANQRIGEYLAVKTLMNVITGVLSYIVLWAMDVDFAVFYAVMLSLLNYIPYVGSFVGVFLPVFLSLAQFGSLATTALLGGLLLSVQMLVDNVIEPNAMGKQLDLSPFVVLVSLAVWSALWGLPGAILAIPLTSLMVIIFDSFPQTRFIAILLSDKVPAPPPA